jgi:hypothetical protein
MDSFSYKLFFLLHIAAIVVAFAPVVVALLPGVDTRGLYRGVGRTVYMASLILAGLFGIILILLSDEVWEFSQTWVSLAFLVWIAMNGVFHAMIFPSRRRGGADRAQLGLAIMDVLLIVMLYLMIWQPGR